MQRRIGLSSAVLPAAVLGCLLSAAPGYAQLNIVINPSATLASNGPALAAFNRAAAQWESRFSDPITVTIDAGLASLSPGVLGSTSSVPLQAGYATIRNQLVADAANEPSNAIVASLPTLAQLSVFVPGSVTSLSGNLTANKAALKAMGFGGLDGTFGATDATITFSSNFAFDFDNSNGVTAGQLDFETVASHEIGHALGFTSVVDQLDTTVNPSSVQLHVLDLFRFSSSGAGEDPSNASEFTTFPRNLVPGEDASFDDTTNEYRMSTGRVNGDGNQASHWKDDALTGIDIGIMDPNLAPGQFKLPTDADFRAFDLIGWDFVPVPEPASVLGMVVVGLAGGWAVRRRAAAPATAA
jgi:hypothetical protein